MKKYLRLSAAILGISLIAACSMAKEKPEVATRLAVFNCGETSVITSVYDETKMTLNLNKKDIEMRQEISASGAKYVSVQNSPNVMFWNKGREATLEVDGKRYPLCKEELN